MKTFSFLVLLFITSIFWVDQLSAQQSAGSPQSDYQVVANPEEVLVGQTFTVTISAPFRFEFDPSFIPISGPAELVPGSLGTSTQSYWSNVGTPIVNYSYIITYKTTGAGNVTVGPVEVYSGTNLLKMGSVSVLIKTMEEFDIHPPSIPGYDAVAHPVSNSVQILKQVVGSIFSGINLPNEIYEGETFLVRTSLYIKNDTRLRMSPTNVYSEPNNSLLLVEQYGSQDSFNQPRAEKLPDIPFSKTDIVDQIYYPINTGPINVAGVQIDFQQRFSIDRLFYLPAPEKTINILPLPPTKEPVQAKVVGNVQLATNFNQATAQVGDIVKIGFMLSGDAYLKPVNLDGIEHDSDGLLYIDQKASYVNVSNKRYPVQSRKTFEVSYQVLKPGKIQLPQITVAVFDPVKKEYRYDKSPLFTVEAEGAALASTSIVQAANKPKTPFADSISPTDEVSEYPPFSIDQLGTESQFTISNTFFFLMNGTLLLVGLFVFGIRNYYFTSGFYSALSSKAKAKAKIATHIKAASLALEQKRIDHMYSELNKALLFAVSTYHHTDLNGKEIDEIQHLLEQAKVDESLATQVVSFMSNLEEQRYHPVKSIEQATQDSAIVQQLIEELSGEVVKST